VNRHFDLLDPPGLPRILSVADNMNPDRALDEQIKRYRQMSGEQRLTIALELHELSCNIAREGIHHQNPNADDAEVECLLRRRLELANSDKQLAELAIAEKLT
jgi:Rv0078B-related antitoxin